MSEEARALKMSGIGRLVIALALALTAGVSGMSGGAAASAGEHAPRVRAQLVSEQSSIEPGGSFWVALRQQIAPGWHTYWENPGDSGEPPTIEWSLPAGFEAGQIVWPHPERIPVGPFMSYGYTGEVLLLTRMKAPSTVVPGASVTVRARAAWLVCEKECIPEEAAVALPLAVSSRAIPDPRWVSPFARALRAVPGPSPWPAEFRATPDRIDLRVAAAGLAADRIDEVWFYPREWGVIDHTAAQRAAISPADIRLEMARGALADVTSRPVEGVLVIRERLDDDVVSQAFALRALPEGATGGAGTAVTLVQALALALIGGLVLNLMPCVLPVVSVKALSLVQHAEGEPATGRRHAVAYAIGVLVSFAAVALVLIGLRQGGEQIGWGFQLQSPTFVTLLAYLLFILALMLSGVVTLGSRLGGVGDALTRRPGYPGSFFSGALATVAATPCTAPFMGVAVGFALTQSPARALLVFEALGLGLALPYLVLGFFPRWRRVLPRPGPWMNRLEQFLAFPLYASVAWLIWVLSLQLGSTGVATGLAGLVLIGFAAWIYGATRSASPGRRRTATAAAALAVFVAVAGSQAGPRMWSGVTAAGAALGPSAERFTPQRLAELRARGTPVFVNFTAAWCITCLVNERIALSSPAVTDAFTRKGAAYLKADWTNRDPQITEVLASFGRSGVPLYVVYPSTRASSNEPTVLPAVLTEGLVLEAVERM